MTLQKQHFKRANKLHRAGRFPEAEEIYLRLLDHNPTDADSLHFLGLLHADTGRPGTAVQLLRAAIGVEGPRPWLCRNLGIMLERSGDRDAAIACYRQALAESPGDHELWAALATLLTSAERRGEAAGAWHRAVESAPPGPEWDPRYRLHWANALALAGDRPAAIEQYDAILRRQPELVEAVFHRAVAHMQENEPKRAIAGFERTLALNPTHARAANNLGILYQLDKRYAAAIAHYKTAIGADTTFHASLHNLGAAWLESGNPRNAAAVFRKALRLDPRHHAAWTHLGNAAIAQNETEKAIECYRRTLAIAPGDAAAKWNLGIVSLLIGNWADGWAGYERRFDVKGSPARRALHAPLWRGEPLCGKTMLLHAEQGFGDTLQFIRYARLLVAEGAKVIVECQPSLLRLLQGSNGVADWIASKPPPQGVQGALPVDHLPLTDFQLPLLSAPALFETRPGNVPLAGGYLSVSPECAEKWKSWLGPSRERLKVGLCWSGNPNHKNDRNRSIPPELLSTLGTAESVDWISLQKGHLPPASLSVRDAAPLLQDFSDTAGLIANLDLVISVDTSVAHLAGALGKPVWVLLPYAPDWRWMLDRDDSPWYSQVRLFRQSNAGEWRTVLQRVASQLPLTRY